MSTNTKEQQVFRQESCEKLAEAAAFVGEHVETFLRKVREGRRPGPDLVFGPRQRYWLPATLIERGVRRQTVTTEKETWR